MVKRRHAAVLVGFGAVSLVVAAVGCGWIVGVEELPGKDSASGGAGGNSAQSSGANMGSTSTGSTSSGSCSECGKADWTKTLKGDGDQVLDDIAINIGNGYIAIAGNLVGPSGQTVFGDACPSNGTCPLVHQGGNDAFVAMIDAEGFPLWSQSLGDGADQSGAGVAVDKNNNTTVVGSFAGTINPGMINPDGGTQTMSKGLSDVFVVRYDASGKHLASNFFGDLKDQFAQDVVVDDKGDIIVVGFFEGSFSFNGGANMLTAVGGYDMFIAKLRSDLSYAWSHRFGVLGKDSNSSAVALQGADSIIMTGNYSGKIDFGNGMMVGNDVTNSLAVVKFDLDGNTVWSKSFACSGTPEARAVVTDSVGDVYVTGLYDGMLNFVDGNNPMLTAADSKDAFVTKLNGMTGKALWSQSFGGAGNQSGESIAVTPDGQNVYVTGALAGSAPFNGNTLTSAGGDDVFLLHYDVIGTEKCGNRFGNDLSQKGQALVINGTGKLLLGSNYQGSLDMGCLSSTSAGGTDVSLTLLTPTP
jgi:hypothetical protein